MTERQRQGQCRGRVTPRLSVVCDRQHNYNHTQLGDTGILCACPAAAGYHYRWCRLFGGDTCSSLVTSQRGLFVLATYIPLLIAAHKPHRLLKDLDLIHTAFNTLSEILENARFGWNIRCSPESRCSFRSNHFHLHCQDFQAF